MYSLGWETERKEVSKALTGEMQREMTPCEGTVPYNNRFNNLQSLEIVVKSAESKD